MVQLPVQITLSSPAVQDWAKTRREHLRPWLLFLQSSKFQTPKTPAQVTSRIIQNVDHFQSNYLCIFIGLIIYCLVTSPALLLALAASLSACYFLNRRSKEKKIIVAGHELSLAQQYLAVSLLSFPVFLWAGAGAVVFWVLGASMFLILLHATFFNIEAVLGPEESFQQPLQHV